MTEPNDSPVQGPAWTCDHDMDDEDSVMGLWDITTSPKLFCSHGFSWYGLPSGVAGLWYVGHFPDFALESELCEGENCYEPCAYVGVASSGHEIRDTDGSVYTQAVPTSFCRNPEHLDLHLEIPEEYDPTALDKALDYVNRNRDVFMFGTIIALIIGGWVSRRWFR